jgi:3-isopropylmalate/(R)-2-methylmalate dehydratase small subunit
MTMIDKILARHADLHGLLGDRRRLGDRRKDRGPDGLSSRGGYRMIVEGRAWLLAEPNINTDLIMPVTAFRLPLDEQVKQVFASYRPGWAREVREGDVLVGGPNFGAGSSGPGAQLLRRLGIRALVAESVNDLFYRNCVNYALPVVECRGVTGVVREGDVVRVDVAEGAIENLPTGQILRGARMPELLLDVIAAGGLLQRLRAQGHL